MNNEKLFIAIGMISDEKIMKSETVIFKHKQETRTWAKWISVTAAACIIIALAFTVLPNIRQTSENPPFSNEGYLPPRAEGDNLQIKLTFEEMIGYSTHIVTAMFVGPEKVDNLDVLRFTIVDVMKGQLENETIFVIAPDYDYDGTIIELRYFPGETYTLFLERNTSLYYSSDRYVCLSVSEKDKTDEEKTRDILRRYADGSLTLGIEIPDEYGSGFTMSDDIADILRVSSDIHEIEVLSVFVESTHAPTTVYNCRINRTMLGSPESSEILIVFFNDSVEINGEYIVLLVQVDEGSLIYNLSSKNSVYTLQEAAKIPELAVFLEAS